MTRDRVAASVSGLQISAEHFQPLPAEPRPLFVPDIHQQQFVAAGNLAANFSFEALIFANSAQNLQIWVGCRERFRELREFAT